VFILSGYICRGSICRGSISRVISVRVHLSGSSSTCDSAHSPGSGLLDSCIIAPGAASWSATTLSVPPVRCSASCHLRPFRRHLLLVGSIGSLIYVSASVVAVCWLFLSLLLLSFVGCRLLLFLLLFVVAVCCLAGCSCVSLHDAGGKSATVV
jgi:hypothetical protein